MEGHLTEYFSKQNEAYKKILDSGKDIFCCEWGGSRDLFTLPKNFVEYNEDGSVELTEKVVDALKEIYGGDKKPLRERGIFPYKEVQRADEFTLSALEDLVENGFTNIKYNPSF